MKKVNFTLLGNSISIKLEMSGNLQSINYVLTSRFRPYEVNKSTDNYHSQTPENEFINDLRFQINRINQTRVFNGNSLISSLRDACRNHIIKYNRLIITDLYTYIDCCMHILEAVNLGDKTKLGQIYIQYANVLLKEFEDYIYIIKPSGAVRLADLS